MKRLVGMALVAGLAVSAVACSDTSGVNDAVPVAVSLKMDGSALASASFDGVALLSMGGIAPKDVDSLLVEVTGLSFLSCDVDCQNGNPDSEPASDPDSDPDDEGCCGYWTHLTVEPSVVIDLVHLPTADEDGFVIASGKLEIGNYQKIRITVGDAYVRFNQPQKKGQWEIPVDEVTGLSDSIPVTVPSGRLNTNVGLVVGDDGSGGDTPVPEEITLLFDPNMTFKNVHTTGSGKVILTPQFRLP